MSIAVGCSQLDVSYPGTVRASHFRDYSFGLCFASSRPSPNLWISDAVGAAIVVHIHTVKAYGVGVALARVAVGVVVAAVVAAGEVAPPPPAVAALRFRPKETTSRPASPSASEPGWSPLRPPLQSRSPAQSPAAGAACGHCLRAGQRTCAHQPKRSARRIPWSPARGTSPA